MLGAVANKSAMKSMERVPILRDNHVLLAGCITRAIPRLLARADTAHNLLVSPNSQTSGGLLFAVAANDEAPALAKLRDAGVEATTIGKAIPYDEPYYLAFV